MEFLFVILNTEKTLYHFLWNKCGFANMCVCDTLIVLSDLIISRSVSISKKEPAFLYIVSSCNGKMDLSLKSM